MIVDSIVFLMTRETLAWKIKEYIANSKLDSNATTNKLVNVLHLIMPLASMIKDSSVMLQT
jgi:hypothetical protein